MPLDLGMEETTIANPQGTLGNNRGLEVQIKIIRIKIVDSLMVIINYLTSL